MVLSTAQFIKCRQGFAVVAKNHGSRFEYAYTMQYLNAIEHLLWGYVVERLISNGLQLDLSRRMLLLCYSHFESTGVNLLVAWSQEKHHCWHLCLEYE